MLSSSPLSRFAARRDQPSPAHPSPPRSRLSHPRRAKYQVQGASELRGLACAPSDLAPPGTRLAVAGRYALRILQLTSHLDSPENVSSLTNLNRNVVVEEVADIWQGSRLGRSYGINEVRWGYRQTNTKLATGCSNGAVVIWDLSKSGNRIDQKKVEHERSVNRVVFSGHTGNWLMSAAQDGDIRLWDMRNNGPSQLVLSTPGDPARDVMFGPDDPFTIASASESGFLLRWDIRKPGQPIDRLQAHVGSILGLDWKSFDDNSPAKGGWCVTTGIDRIVKVWDMSAPSLSYAKPIHTLHPTHACFRPLWRSEHTTELALIPMGPSSEPEALSMSAVNPPTPSDNENIPSMSDNWSNDIEIWDVRREYLPKYVLKSGEGNPLNHVLPTPTTAWTTHRSGVFVQHDINLDAEQPLRDIPRATLGWSVKGDLVFESKPRYMDEIFFTSKEKSIKGPSFKPQGRLTITKNELGLDIPTFIYLAENYSIDCSSSFSQACLKNSQAAQTVGYDIVSRLWQLLNLLFSSPNVENCHVSPSRRTSDTTQAAKSLDNQSNVPINTSLPERHENVPQPEVTNTGTFWHKYFYGNNHANGSGSGGASSSADQRQHSRSPATAESRSPENMSRSQSPAQFSPKGKPTSVVTDSLGQDFGGAINSTISSSKRNSQLGKSMRKKQQSTFTDLLGSSEESDEGVDDDDDDLSGDEAVHSSSAGAPTAPASYSSTSVTSVASSVISRAFQSGRRASAASSSSPQETRMKVAGALTSVDEQQKEANEKSLRNKSSKQGLHGKLGDNHNTIKNDALLNNDQRTRRGSETTLRQGTESNAGDRSNSHMRSSRLRKSTSSNAGAEGALSGLFHNLHMNLKNVLQELADQGDVQTAVVVMFLLRDKMNFDDEFLKRATIAYIGMFAACKRKRGIAELLRQLGLTRVAALFTKYSKIEDILQKSQESTMIYTTCRSCMKASVQAPYSLCTKCDTYMMVCCICRERIRELVTLCGQCGHCAHQSCITDFSSKRTKGRLKGSEIVEMSECPAGCGCISCILVI